MTLLLVAKMKRYSTEQLKKDPQVIQELLPLVPEPIVTVNQKIKWLERIRMMMVLEVCDRTPGSVKDFGYSLNDLYAFFGVDPQDLWKDPVVEPSSEKVIAGPWIRNG